MTLVFGGRNAHGEYVEDRLVFRVMEVEKHQIFLDGRRVLEVEHNRWRIYRLDGTSRALVNGWKIEP